MKKASGRIVIAGGTGLIGSALAASLSQRGFDVVVLSRRSPAEARVPPGCRAAQWDGRTGAGWQGEARGARAIVNLAGESVASGRWTTSRKQRILRSRLDAAAAVIAAVAAVEQPEERPEVLLQASAVGYYGDRKDQRLDEQSRPGEGFLARTTVSWEKASEPVEAMGVRRVLLRTGLVLAREGGALAAMAPPFRFGLGARLGDGRQWMPWIHLEDEVGAIEALLLDESARGPFDLSSPNPVTNAEFTKTLGKVLRRPAVLGVPEFVLRTVLGEMADVVLGSQRLAAARLLAHGYSFRFPELELALRELFAAAPRAR